MTFETFMNYFTAANTMELLLALMIFIVLITLVQMTRNPNDELDLKDLVSSDGKLNEKKFTRFGAWVISTWGFVYILVNNPGNFPEWYFVGYMMVWVGNAIMDKWTVKERHQDMTNKEEK
jgi:hypothetical protein